MSPSKRIRSVVSILYYKGLVEKNLNEKQIEFLANIEILHSASLIHDDIIDESKTRRGQKTISEQFSTKLVVITGDYLMSVVMESFADLGCAKVISSTIRKMCEGEIYQNFNRFKIPTIEEYIEKSKNKTGYLFDSAIRTTVELGQIGNFDVMNCEQFAQNLGVAFQINDDLQNFTRKDPLKPFNNDIEDGIYTAPIILGGCIDNLSIGIEKTKILLNNYLEKAIMNVKSLPLNFYSQQLEELLQK